MQAYDNEPEDGDEEEANDDAESFEEQGEVRQFLQTQS